MPSRMPRYGPRWSGPVVTDVAVSLLRSMRQAGGLVVADGIVSTVLLADADQRVAGEHDAIAEHLTLLDPDALALVRALAVWGRPATPAALARLTGSRPAALVGSAQAAIDAGILVARDDATLAFTHDLYADVAYARLAPPLRAVLHRAIVEHPDVADDHPSIAHHLLAAGADPAEVDAAVRRAEGELEFAPGVAADLLDTVAERAQNAGVRPGLHVDLAVAPTRTGQLNRAAVVAEEGIAAASDLDEIANLHRILMFALTTKGKTDRVRELIDLTVQFPIGDDAEEALTDLRAYVGILDGSAPVPRQPLCTDAQVRSLGGVIGESLRRYLRGDLPEALRLSLIAARRQAVEDVADPGSVPTNSSAEIWPALIEQALHGPRAAADLLATSTAQRTRRGAEWMAAYHDFTRGSIELGLGHLGDAAAAWDTGLDRVASADMGWTSMAIGGRILVDVLCGDLAAATLRLDDWDAGGLPEQFGLPVVGRARAQLFEASRKPRRASAAAATVWDRAVHQGLDVMLPEYSVDCARIAVRANDAVLLGRIVDGLDAMQFAPSPAMAPLALLGRTRAAATLGVADESEVLDAAVVAADAMTSIGHARGSSRRRGSGVRGDDTGRPRYRARLGASRVGRRTCDECADGRHPHRVADARTRFAPGPGGTAGTASLRMGEPDEDGGDGGRVGGSGIVGCGDRRSTRHLDANRADTRVACADETRVADAGRIGGLRGEAAAPRRLDLSATRHEWHGNLRHDTDVCEGATAQSGDISAPIPGVEP